MKSLTAEMQTFDTTITYRYDMLGRIVAIGSAEDDAFFAEYTYAGTGEIRTETCNPRKVAIQTRATFDPLGRTLTSVNPFFTENISFRKDGDLRGEYLDGNVSMQSIEFSETSFPSSGPTSHSYEYTYDPLGRLTDAVATDLKSKAKVPEWSFSNGKHNADGSLVSAQWGGRVHEYERADNSHRIIRIVDAATGTALHEFSHDGSGRVISDAAAGITNISYDFLSGMTARVDMASGDSVSYLQSAMQGVAMRVTNESGTQSRTVCLGASDGPVSMEISRDAQGRWSERLLVQGPTGLVSIVNDGEVSFLVRDLRGSMRVLVDNKAEPCAWFNYLPYGEDMPGNTNANSAIAAQTRERFICAQWERTTGLYALPARQYAANAGVLLQPDPVDQTPDVYAWCGNDPVNAADPSGAVSWRSAWARYLGSEVFVPAHTTTSKKWILEWTQNTKIDYSEGITTIEDVEKRSMEFDKKAHAIAYRANHKTFGSVKKITRTVTHYGDAWVVDPTQGVKWSQITGAKWWAAPAYWGFWRSAYGRMAILRITKAAVMGVASGLSTAWAFKQGGVSDKHSRDAALIMAFETAGFQFVCDCVFTYAAVPWAVGRAGADTTSKWGHAMTAGVFMGYSWGAGSQGITKSVLYGVWCPDINRKNIGKYIGISAGTFFLSFAWVLAGGIVAYGIRVQRKLSLQVTSSSFSTAATAPGWQIRSFAARGMGWKFWGRAGCDFLWLGMATCWNLGVVPQITKHAK